MQALPLDFEPSDIFRNFAFFDRGAHVVPMSKIWQQSFRIEPFGVSRHPYQQ